MYFPTYKNYLYDQNKNSNIFQKTQLLELLAGQLLGLLVARLTIYATTWCTNISGG